MKAIVSGGAGFIGSHLVEELLENDYEVIVLDNFSTGRRENLNFLSSNNLKIYNVDISEFERIKPYFKDVDCVFHLAALADIVPSVEKPLLYHRSNVDGTINMLEASRKYKIKKFIYSASSSCYGIPDFFPTDEAANIDPQYPYALTKYLAEEYCLSWSKIYKLPVISLRLFNVYGPRSRTSGTYGAVFGVFLAQKLKNLPFTIVGDGNQTRDFIFVKDVARAFRIAAESKFENEVFNLGSGRPQSINRLVELLGGSSVYIPKRPGEPDCTHADIKKAKSMLGWQPQVSFEDGVKEMLNNIGYWRDAPVWTPQMIEESTRQWFKYLSPTK